VPIERLLLEPIALRGICHLVGVGCTWLLGFLVQCFEALPAHLAAQHWAIHKFVRQTNDIGPFNATLRRRVARPVRETLSFAKKLAEHVGAITNFICHNNLTQAAA
jgi:hypothetical protein